MICSLDPARRRDWPDLLTHLVFLYNSTPHQVTGLSPYRMFGRDPYTPLDHLLSNAKKTWDEDFTEEQAQALQTAHKVAKERTETSQQKEKEKHDVLPQSVPLEIGTQVLLKRCAFDGRHKLSDKFYRDPFTIVSVNQEQDVYSIRPLFGGPVQIVNRRLLIKDPREVVVHLCRLEEPRPYQSDSVGNDHKADLQDTPEEEENFPLCTLVDVSEKGDRASG